MITKNSPFALRDFIVQESHIIRNPSEIQQDPVEIDINPSGFIYESDKLFQLNLEIHIEAKESKRVKIDLLAIGIFEFKEDLTKDQIPKYFLINAPAIVFPFVRSYISALTTLSGEGTVNLPIINMEGFEEQLKNSISYAEMT